ncbi:MAG: acyl-CoA synthetase [Actinomycetota bacterium]
MSDTPTLGFWKYAAENPEKLCIVDPDGTEHTFGEVLARVNQYSYGLRALGVQAGDVIATVLPNEHTLIELYMAALQIGVYFTPVNWHLVAREIEYILSDSEAKVVVGSERFADAVKKACDGAGVPAEARFASGRVEGFRDISELAAGQPTTRPDDLTAGQAMMYTSGTTGNPKGVRRKMAGVHPDESGAAMAFFPLMFDFKPGDGVHLTVGPLYHAAQIMFATSSLHLGHTDVLMDKWTPEGTLERVEKYQVSTSHLVPTMFHRLLAMPEEERNKYDVSSWTNVVHAAAPCPVPTKRAMFDWWGPVIYEYYAATEGGGTTVKPDEWLRKPGTVGQPWPTAEIKILDENGEEQPPNTPGTVWIKPPGAAAFEYHKDKKKTSDSWKDGFFTVGDIGYVDEDGWLFLSDRKVDMIISGGVNIYPAEIENVILQHPSVADVGVIGIPNDDWGEEVKALVELNTGYEPSDELIAELGEYCRENLAGYKVPRSIEFREHLPRTDTGKLLKRELREPYWTGKERRI